MIVWSIAVRWAVDRSDSVGAFYYPDSFNYVAVPLGDGAPHSYHGPVVHWVWDALMVGELTEQRVVALQRVLGIVAVVLVVLTLRRVVSDYVALAAGLLLGVQPMALLFERTMLTEAVALALVAAQLWLVGEVLGGLRGRWELVAIASLGFVSGVLIALRPSTRLVALVPVAAIAWVLARRLRVPATRRVGSVSVAVLVVSFALVPFGLMRTNADHYGEWALTPATGTALFNATGWRLDCAVVAPGATPLAAAAGNQVCGGERPAQEPMWDIGSPLFRSFAPSANFGETQSQLSAWARQAAFEHPFAVASDVVARGAEQVVGPDFEVRLYTAGAEWVATQGARTAFPEHERWFGGTDRTNPATIPPVLDLVRGSTWMPGLLLTITLGGLAWPLLGAVRRRSLRSLFDPVGVGTVLGAIAVAMSGALLLAVGVGGNPLVRYWAPLLPALVIGAAVTVDRAIVAVAHRRDERGEGGSPG